MMNIRRKEGFTLVELLVAITLFSLAVSISVGGFVRALRTQRELITLISANSNASLSIEQIAREMRTGTNFSCVGNPCTEITFKNAYGEDVRYYSELVSGPTERGALMREANRIPETMTAENVDIRHLYFYLMSSGSNPPRITISIGVSGKSSELEHNVTNIQTTISARNF